MYGILGCFLNSAIHKAFNNAAVAVIIAINNNAFVKPSIINKAPLLSFPLDKKAYTQYNISAAGFSVRGSVL
jgi:hypothetical protein